MINRSLRCFLIVFAFLEHGTGAAGEPNHTAWSATFENDLFFNTDHYYTDGVQLSIRQDSSDNSRLLSPLADWLCSQIGCNPGEFREVRYNTGQLMYTPTDITNPFPQPFDHPWAGLLYHEQEFVYQSRLSETTISTEIGVIGPKSYVEQTQKFIHRLRNFPTPEGWDNQAKSQLGLMASLEKRYALPAFSQQSEGGVDYSTSPYWRLAVGNIMTYGAAGIAFQIGKAIPEITPKPIGGITSKALGPGRDASCLFSWLQCTAFSSLEVRALAWNVFLDGSPRTYESQVQRRNLVADLQLGGRLTFPRTRIHIGCPVFLQVTATRRSREFKSAQGASSQAFAAITTGCDY